MGGGSVEVESDVAGDRCRKLDCLRRTRKKRDGGGSDGRKKGDGGGSDGRSVSETQVRGERVSECGREFFNNQF